MSVELSHHSMEILREAGEPKGEREELTPFVPNVLFFLGECLKRGVWPKPPPPAEERRRTTMRIVSD